MNSISGILNIAKPSGVTSRKVVDWVLRRIRPAKAGHAGTLDPLASGVLIVCVGAATRLIEYVQRQPKRYVGQFRLGQTSTTEDVEGVVTDLPAPPIPTLDDLRRAAEQWTGKITQTPPAFSALKVAGRRAYDLARRGEAVELAPREVEIYELRVTGYAYPDFTLEIASSAGTYVRTLGRDVAKTCGSDAVMTALVRSAVGDFQLADSLAADQIAAVDLVARMLPLSRAVGSLPRVTLTDQELVRIGYGKFIALPADAPAAETAAFDGSGELAAILKKRPDGLWCGVRTFIAPPASRA